MSSWQELFSSIGSLATSGTVRWTLAASATLVWLSLGWIYADQETDLIQEVEIVAFLLAVIGWVSVLVSDAAPIAFQKIGNQRYRRRLLNMALSLPTEGKIALVMLVSNSRRFDIPVNILLPWVQTCISAGIFEVTNSNEPTKAWVEIEYEIWKHRFVIKDALVKFLAESLTEEQQTASKESALNAFWA